MSFDDELRRAASELGREPMPPGVLDEALDEQSRPRWLLQVAGVMVAGVIVVAGVGVAADQLTPEPSASSVASPSGLVSPSDQVNGPVSITEEESGIRLSVTLDRGTTTFGERVWADALVENLGPGVVFWEHGGGCEWPVVIRVVPDVPGEAPNPGRDDWPGHLGILKDTLTPESSIPDQQLSFVAEELVGTDAGIGCFSIWVTEELAEGADVNHRAAWDSDAYMGMPPVPGAYSVEVTFRFTRGAPPEPNGDRELVTVTLPMVVEGEVVDWLSPEQAIDALLSDERFVDLLADAPLDQWTDHYISFEEDRWVLTLKLGTTAADPTPHTALIGVVDARTGVVLEVRRDAYPAPEG